MTHNLYHKFILLLAGLLCFEILAAFSYNPVMAADNHIRRVRVGYYITPGFQEYNEQTGRYSGYSYEYLLALSQYTGWDYELIPTTFQDGLELLKEGKIDLLNNVSRTPEREQYFDFSFIPSGHNYASIAMLPEHASVSFEDFSSFDQLNIGVAKNSHFRQSMLDYLNLNNAHPQITVFDTSAQVLDALQKGEINAAQITSSQRRDVHLVGKFSPEAFFFAVRKNNSALLHELNSAMNQLQTSDPYFESVLYNKYYDSTPESSLILSPAESAYIKSQPVINVIYSPSWIPLSYQNEQGEFAGALSIIYRMIAERTGLKFNYICAANGADIAERFKENSDSLIVEMPNDYIWADRLHALITRSYVALKTIEVYRSNRTEQPKIIALPRNYYLADFCSQQLGSDYVYRYYDSYDECMDAVQSGDVDATYVNSYQAEFYESQTDYRDLTFKLAHNLDFSISIAVAKTADPRLYSIINKTLETINGKDIIYILNESTMNAQSHNLLNMLYKNPKASLPLLVIFSFLAATLLYSFIYVSAIRRKNIQLQNATAAKTQFFSQMSHDMRTPMNVILSLSALGLDKEASVETKNDFLQKINLSGNYLLGLINDTLDMSKIESGKLEIKKAPMLSTLFIKDLVDTAKLMADKKHITFTTHIEKLHEAYINVDQFHTKQIFMNLISNAVKFTPDGGSIFVSVEPIERTLYNVKTKITIRDTGIGMSPEFVKKIYEPFSQENTAYTAEYKGTGLGMAIVKRLIELLNGTIAVKSKPNIGTEFTIFLDFELLPDYQQPRKQAAPTSELDFTGLKVLVCEDNLLNQEIMQRLLAKKHCTVVCADNGRQGIDAFKASALDEFSIILMDVRMPVMDGLEAAAVIRQLDRRDAATIPIIAVTANAYAEDVQACLAAGMNTHISKPVNPEELYKQIASQLD